MGDGKVEAKRRESGTFAFAFTLSAPAATVTRATQHHHHNHHHHHHHHHHTISIVTSMCVLVISAASASNGSTMSDQLSALESSTQKLPGHPHRCNDQGIAIRHVAPDAPHGPGYVCLLILDAMALIQDDEAPCDGVTHCMFQVLRLEHLVCRHAHIKRGRVRQNLRPTKCAQSVPWERERYLKHPVLLCPGHRNSA